MSILKMSSIIIHTKNDSDLRLLVDLARRLGAIIEKKESSSYSKEIIKKIHEAEMEIKKGEFYEYNGELKETLFGDV